MSYSGVWNGVMGEGSSGMWSGVVKLCRLEWGECDLERSVGCGGAGVLGEELGVKSRLE